MCHELIRHVFCKRRIETAADVNCCQLFALAVIVCLELLPLALEICLFGVYL